MIFEMALRAPKLYKERAMMSKLCVESYPSSLYRFEKSCFWPFVLTFGCGKGGGNFMPMNNFQCTLLVVGSQNVRIQNDSVKQCLN